MSYTIQGIIFPKSCVVDLKKFELRSVEIGSNLILVPLTYDYVESREIPFLPLTDGSVELKQPPAEYCCQAGGYKN